jgi:hypothetical protein
MTTDELRGAVKALQDYERLEQKDARPDEITPIVLQYLGMV